MTKKAIATLAAAVVLTAISALAATAQAEPSFEAFQTVWWEGAEEEALAVASFDSTQVEAEPIKLAVGGPSLKCTTATATASIEGLSSTLSLAPAYSGCKVTVFGISFPATIAMNGCSFAVSSLEEGEAETFNAQAAITCPEKSSILVTVKNFAGTKSTCLIHIGAQSGLKGVKVLNMAETSSVTIKSEISTLQAVVTKGEESCFLTPGTYSNSTLTGNTSLTSTGSGEKATPPPANPPKPKIAKATKFHFAYELNKVEIHGIGTTGQRFSFDSIVFECAPLASEMVRGAEGGKTAYLGGVAEYVVCQDELMKEVTMLMHECEITLTAELVQGTRLAGRLAISCEGNPIEVVSGMCVIKIPSQVGPTKLGHTRVSFENIGEKAGREVIANIEVSGIQYEEGAGCKNANKATANGKLSGTMKFHADEFGGEKQAGLWVEKT